MINFSNLPVRKKSYGGANGNKLSILIDNEIYMLKLPQKATKNEYLSYANSSISEYIGSHIYNLLKINAQETLLGLYTYNNIERISVACKDFEKNGYVLKDFASVKNQIIDSSSNGYGTELKDILQTIENQHIIDPIELSNHFWDMFIIDALIGNWDRHNGNWGFILNKESEQIIFAPIYDCGSCLNPMLEDSDIQKISETELKNLAINTYSCIKENGKKINYWHKMAYRL